MRKHLTQSFKVHNKGEVHKGTEGRVLKIVTEGRVLLKDWDRGEGIT